MVYDVIESMPVDKNSGVLSDETMRLIGYYSIKKYPDTLRLIVYEDFEAGKVYHFLTNNVSIEDPLTIAELYRNVGKLSCSSNGSNSICILRPSTEHPRTPFTRKSG